MKALFVVTLAIAAVAAVAAADRDGDGVRPYTPEELETLEEEARHIREVAKVLGIISCVTVLVPIVTFFYFPEKRRFPARLPVHMCLAVLGVCVSVLGGVYWRDAFCPYQAIGITLFGNAAVFWWLLISLNFYQVAVRDCTDRRSEGWFYIVGYAFPVVLTVVAKACDMLDTRTHPLHWECWMNQTKSFGQWVFFYSEMAVAVSIGLVLWPRIAWRIWHLHKGDFSDAVSHMTMLAYSRHVLFIILYFVVFVVMFVYRLMSTYGSGASYHLTMAHTVCIAGTGLYCFFVFGVSQQNYYLWRNALCGTRGSGDHAIVGGGQRRGRVGSHRHSSRHGSPYTPNNARISSPLVHPPAQGEEAYWDDPYDHQTPPTGYGYQPQQIYYTAYD